MGPATTPLKFLSTGVGIHADHLALASSRYRHQIAHFDQGVGRRRNLRPEPVALHHQIPQPSAPPTVFAQPKISSTRLRFRWLTWYPGLWASLAKTALPPLYPCGRCTV